MKTRRIVLPKEAYTYPPILACWKVNVYRFTGKTFYTDKRESLIPYWLTDQITNPMKELKTAAELRKQYETAMGQAAQAELKTVIEKINSATGLSIYLNKALSKPVEAILVEKGYKCGFVQTGINESEYKISW